jgi:hypothetical protein
VYDNEDMSDEAWATWEREKEKLFSPESLRHYDDVGWAPLYEDATGWDVARSEYVIDYNGVNRKPSFGGIWRVRQEKAFVPLSSSKKHRLILLDEMQPPSVYGSRKRSKTSWVGRSRECWLKKTANRIKMGITSTLRLMRRASFYGPADVSISMCASVQ